MQLSQWRRRNDTEPSNRTNLERFILLYEADGYDRTLEVQIHRSECRLRSPERFSTYIAVRSPAQPPGTRLLAVSHPKVIGCSSRANSHF